MAYPNLVADIDPRKFVLVPCYAKSLPQAEGFSFFTITVTNLFCVVVASLFRFGTGITQQLGTSYWIRFCQHYLYYVTNIAYVLILSSV